MEKALSSIVHTPEGMILISDGLAQYVMNLCSWNGISKPTAKLTPPGRDRWTGHISNLWAILRVPVALWENRVSNVWPAGMVMIML